MAQDEKGITETMSQLGTDYTDYTAFYDDGTTHC
jgi:hypothetical protein